MRLTDEKITDIKEYLNRSIKVTASSLIPQLSKYGLDLIDTIEALQQENEQLQAQLDEWKYEAKCHMDEVVARDKEIEKLRAQVARMRDALEYYADIKRWGEVNLIYVPSPDKARKALSNTPADYHNPADVEALRKAMEAIQRAKENFEPYGEYEYDVRYDLEEALAEIDKVMGGKEDE